MIPVVGVFTLVPNAGPLTTFELRVTGLPAAFSDLGGVCAFNSEIVLLVAGVQLDEVALSARLDASLKLGKNVDLSVGYTGLIGSTISDHRARATLQVQF